MIANSVISSALGMLVSMIPNVVFWRLQRCSGTLSAKQVVRRLYLAELAKFGGLVSLLIIILQWSKLNTKFFLAAFIASELIRWGYNWLSLLRVKSK